MFTGIIQELGTLEKRIPQGTKALLVFKTSKSFLRNVKLGESIAVEGVCLTVIRHTAASFSVEVIPETLRDTTLGDLIPGKSRINMERALRMGDSLGGHMVSGHVDGKGVITGLDNRGGNYLLRIKPSKKILNQLVSKGSVGIDGISLTVQKITSKEFEIGIIPHTWKVTSLSVKGIGSSINIELDMFTKFVEQAVRNIRRRRRK
jgi:riboflavin synthase